jgi:AcrR family transcriptional regulator
MNKAKVMASRPREPVGLTRDDVVAAALDLIDEVGFDAFSIRALAKRMGVYPTALHWHVGSRTELLALVVTQVVLSIEAPTGESWEPFIRTLASEFRRTLHAHPAIAPAFVAQVVSATPALPVIDTLLAHFEHAGLTGEQLRDAYNAVVGAVVGFVGMELAEAPTDDNDAWASRFADTLDHVDADAYPALARNMPYLRNNAFLTRWEGGRTRPMDAAWATLLDILVAGLHARISTPTA